MKVGYAFLVADLFHIGHLRIIKKAKKMCDYLVIGILTDKAVMSYKRKPIMTFQQRKEIVEDLRSVDYVIPQRKRDPSDNIKEIYKMFDDPEIIVFHGNDWPKKSFPGQEMLKKVGGKLVLLPYYKPLSTTKIINMIGKRWKAKDV